MIKVGKVSQVGLEKLIQDQLKDNLYEIDRFLNKVALNVRQEAKASRGPKGFDDVTGNLRLSIRKKKSKFEDGGYIVAATGRNKGKGEGDKGYHAHLVEFGHVKVLWGKPTGERVPPHPFMRPAVERASKYAAGLIKGMK